MLGKKLNQSICLKEYITEKEYKQINELQDICNSIDKVNLKLELDYKLNMQKNSGIGLKNINEFLYYVDETLVAYIGISSFGSNIGEINGMTHPNWRRKGIAKKLLKIAIEECNERNFNKILLLTDGKSNSGVEFIKAANANYDFSEYRMKRLNNASSESTNSVKLRKAEKIDGKEVERQNKIFFEGVEDNESSQEEEQTLNEGTYMVELKGEAIGKINLEYSDDLTFIYGFGILPDFRGKGYGKAALKEALCLINEKNINEVQLDVECKNNTALNLYKTCGFEEVSVMNYYKYDIL